MSRAARLLAGAAVGIVIALATKVGGAVSEGEPSFDTAWACSLRCGVCGLNFPPEEDYVECPQCGEDTRPMPYASPNIPSDEARSMLNHARFDEWCEENGRV